MPVQTFAAQPSNALTTPFPCMINSLSRVHTSSNPSLGQDEALELAADGRNARATPQPHKVGKPEARGCAAWCVHQWRNSLSGRTKRPRYVAWFTVHQMMHSMHAQVRWVADERPCRLDKKAPVCGATGARLPASSLRANLPDLHVCEGVADRFRARQPYAAALRRTATRWPRSLCCTAQHAPCWRSTAIAAWWLARDGRRHPLPPPPAAAGTSRAAPRPPA